MSSAISSSMISTTITIVLNSCKNKDGYELESFVSSPLSLSCEQIDFLKTKYFINQRKSSMKHMERAKNSCFLIVTHHPTDHQTIVLKNSNKDTIQEGQNAVHLHLTSMQLACSMT
ncbi:hypothetical protein DERP_005562 [Dermatophagoides pteronyssinus]|uniref:Uncharacterized protein n=1 Tax=Dermatophagoides pteronyssinus TaxID=6956 RepID=A0ABQ8JN98_DERPT|nr:hypothetical protein DERP_005562 [Dermatophagoides pteronyssinus]